MTGPQVFPLIGSPGDGIATEVPHRGVTGRGRGPEPPTQIHRHGEQRGLRRCPHSNTHLHPWLVEPESQFGTLQRGLGKWSVLFVLTASLQVQTGLPLDLLPTLQ